MKQRQQKELAQSIIAKVQKELENPKALQQILQQSVADVESTSHSSPSPHPARDRPVTNNDTPGIVSSKAQ